MKRILNVLIIFLLFLLPSEAQEAERKFTLGGYLTTMQSAMFDTISGPVVYDNLLHNRVNFKTFLSDKISFAAEVRNRLFTGDMARGGKAYSEMIGTDQGWADMSWNLINENSFFLNSTVDRLWIDMNLKNLEVRIGRQRINWGQTLVWNPNDVFNAYSFFDFDYVERPGSDAVRIQYYPSSSSTFEVAVKADSENDVTAAGLYRFNKWGYDLQLLAGYSNGEDLVFGAGWSGAIGTVSFRGESSFFYPVASTVSDLGKLIITAGADKVFEKNSMLQVQVMICNEPLRLTSFNSFYSGNLSAKDLAFSRFSAFGSFTWAVNPLFNMTLSGMWFPDLDGYFAGPSADYSLSENLDFSLIWQHFDSRMNNERTRINLGFLRIKYSF